MSQAGGNTLGTWGAYPDLEKHTVCGPRALLIMKSKKGGKKQEKTPKNMMLVK